jgi:hypothetical protein
MSRSEREKDAYDGYMNICPNDDDDGYMVVFASVEGERQEVSRKLVKAICSRNDDEAVAIFKEHLAIIETNPHKITGGSLILAAKYNCGNLMSYISSLEKLPKILVNGAIPHLDAKIRPTLLTTAVSHGAYNSVKALIDDLNADVNVTDAFRTSPLIALALSNTKNKTLEIAQKLIESDCDINARDNSGVTAMMVTKLLNNKDLSELLKGNNAEYSEQDKLIVKASKKDFFKPSPSPKQPSSAKRSTGCALQ